MRKGSKSSSIQRRRATGTSWEYFFQIHDPTTRNRQGNDIGTSYRSAIFYTSDEQRKVAEDTIADVNASGLWPGKVVTEVTPVGDFWEAEPEHQDYLERYPNGGDGCRTEKVLHPPRPARPSLNRKFATREAV
jgi:peptide methionine sulfoxide reductase MsrA